MNIKIGPRTKVKFAGYYFGISQEIQVGCKNICEPRCPLPKDVTDDDTDG